MSSQSFTDSESAQTHAFRVLTIVARPLDEPELPDIADAWALTDGLAQIEAPAHIRFLEPPTIEEFRSALLDQWDVIHFDGHGVATPGGGLLAFENEDGTFASLSARDFAEMLSLSGGSPRLIILSACESARGSSDGLAGELVSAGMLAVIGTRESVSVEWTMTLMRQLYAALGRGRSIKEAFDFARPSLRQIPNYNPRSTTPSFDLPVLLGSGVDARLCDGTGRGQPLVEHARLFGWTERWAGKFHGDFLGEDAQGQLINPPQGRKGLIVQAARALLRDEKLVTLTGIGGIGKTALAAIVARNMAWRFPGGVFWVDGRDYLTSSIPLGAVLDSFEPVLGSELLQLSTERKRIQVRGYMNRLDSPCLIVLDNADNASEEAMRFLKEMPPRCAALLTSREAPEAGGALIGLKSMSPEESLDFLLDEVGRRKSDPSWYLGTGDEGELQVSLSDTDQTALSEIARHLDGHPLALLQAAALIASDGIRRTLELVRAHPAQGREIHERFDFSYLPLSDELKRLLHRLAAFPVDFDEKAVSNVCTNEHFAASDEMIPDWQPGLRALRGKSLIEQHDFSDLYRRFRLHPVTRDYVRAKVLQLPPHSSDEVSSSLSGTELMQAEDFRVARYFLALGHEFASHLNNLQTASSVVELVSLERFNFLAAQDILISQGRLDLTISVTYPLYKLFSRSGHWEDCRHITEKGMDAAKVLDKKAPVANLTHNLAVLLYRTGDNAEARKLHEESRKIMSDLGDKAGEASSLHQLGMLAEHTGDYDEARRLYEESLKIKRQLGNKAGEASSLHQLGTLAAHTGDYDEARRLYEESLKIARQLGNKDGEADSLHQLGILMQLTGDYDEARKLYEETLKIKRQLGNKDGEASSLHQLGTLAEHTGDYDEARRLYEESLKIARQLGDKAGEASSLHQLGGLAELTGDYDEARRLYEESLKITRQLGNKAGEADSLHQLGRLAELTGDYDEARRLYEESLKIARQLGNKAGEAFSLAQLALLDDQEGKYRDGIEHSRQAEEILLRLGNPIDIAKIKEQIERLERRAEGETQ